MVARSSGGVGVMVVKVDPEQVHAMVDESCASQGVPVKVTDPTAVRTVAALLRAGRSELPVERKPRRVKAVPAPNGGSDRDAVHDGGDDGLLE